MSLIIDNKEVAAINIGNKEVVRISQGQTVLWEKNDPIDYFRIVNVDSVSGDITFPQNATNLEYNIDGGAWVNPSTSSVTITLQPNEVLNMRAKSGTRFTIGSSVMTCTFTFDVEGNLATLINGQNPNSVTTIPSDFCRGWFRGQTKIRYADKLHLGTITTLMGGSMYFMFRDSSLVKGMDLSNISTFSANNGISTIYYGCRSITEVTAPSIISTDGNMHRWLDNVSASGICICPNAYVYNNMPVNSSTIDYGIPSGWTKSYDCRNWDNEGYEDKGHCDCEFNYVEQGYMDEAECLCTEFQECTVETPTISFENGVYQDVCQKFNGNGTVTITCPQSGVAIYYRYVAQTCVNDVPTFDDITQESWNVYSNAITLTNYKSCGSTNGQFKIQAKATKSGMDDSLIAESVVTVYSDQGPCNCTDDFYVMGYDSEGECYCTESGDNMGYETIEDCMCNEYQECPEP